MGGRLVGVATLWEVIAIFVLPLGCFVPRSIAIAASTTVATVAAGGTTICDCHRYHRCCDERGHFLFHVGHDISYSGVGAALR